MISAFRRAFQQELPVDGWGPFQLKVSLDL
jgi:hypothetical protein